MRTIPVYNWMQLHEHNDVRFMAKRATDLEHDEINYVENSVMRKNFFRIWNQTIKEFGLSDKYREYMEMQKRWGIEMAKYLQTGDRMHVTEANIIKIDLDTRFREENPTKVGEVIAMIEKHFGIHLDTRKCSLYKYQNYLNLMNKQLDHGA